jgi:hypothetical protein
MANEVRARAIGRRADCELHQTNAVATRTAAPAPIALAAPQRDGDRMRPCYCNRCHLITGPYTPDQCRLCWLYHHAPAYRALWDSAARGVAAPPVGRHRGEPVPGRVPHLPGPGTPQGLRLRRPRPQHHRHSAPHPRLLQAVPRLPDRLAAPGHTMTNGSSSQQRRPEPCPYAGFRNRSRRRNWPRFRREHIYARAEADCSWDTIGRRRICRRCAAFFGVLADIWRIVAYLLQTTDWND